MLRGIHVKLLDFPWNNRIIFVLRIWWTESTCPWTMWGMVHGGPATMAGTELHRSSAMGRSGRRGLAVIEGKGRGRCRDSILLLTGDGEAARQRSLTAAIGVHRSGEGREEEASWWPKWMRGGAVKVWALLYSPGMVKRADNCSNSPAMECDVIALNPSVLGE
jgi:hypothetical protein